MWVATSLLPAERLKESQRSLLSLLHPLGSGYVSFHAINLTSRRLLLAPHAWDGLKEKGPPSKVSTDKTLHSEKEKLVGGHAERRRERRNGRWRAKRRRLDYVDVYNTRHAHVSQRAEEKGGDTKSSALRQQVGFVRGRKTKFVEPQLRRKISLSLSVRASQLFIRKCVSKGGMGWNRQWRSE